MVKFMMKCLLLTTVLLFGILLGMQQANTGMKQMKGYDDPSFATVFHVEDNPDNGKIEATVLGEEMNSKNIEEKRQKLEKIKSFNLFSSMGEKLATGVSYLFEKMIAIFSVGVDRLLK